MYKPHISNRLLASEVVSGQICTMCFHHLSYKTFISFFTVHVWTPTVFTFLLLNCSREKNRRGSLHCQARS